MICKYKSTNKFKVLLCITKNSIKNPSFVFTQLKDQTVPFLTIQFSVSHLFALSLKCQNSSI